ncbi:MAG TPA: twin-arginine translocation signal domain-containing protein [Terracidiphilus sp.]|nr:twin-arginine translocation signal domain-containing protein [Terracidiphilus sp.]
MGFGLNRPLSRRHFLKAGAGLAATAAAPASWARIAQASGAASAEKMIGIQISAISFTDEGVNKVLDLLQERAQVNTLFLSAFTYDLGTGGRQVPSRPLPDHGPREYDHFHGGNFATPHAQFYVDTILKQTKAPDLGNVDILEMVLPETKKRGMKVYAWNYNIWRRDIPNIEQLEEIDINGQHAPTCCAFNPEYKKFVIDLTKDHCTSYDIDGVMWGAEQQGPLNNALGANAGNWDVPITCFCQFHRQAAKERGIDVDRAIEGYKKLIAFTVQSRANQRPTDGYFVEFWRIMVDYPEILAWEKLWSDGKAGTYEDIFKTAKGVRQNLQVGFHIWHTNSFSPFFRAEQDYARFARFADYLKPVLYNNCAGPRYAKYIGKVDSTLLHDLPPEEALDVNNRWLDYEGMTPEPMSLAKITTGGLPAEYVARETRRALEDVKGKCKIYPGIDIDIPTAADDKQTEPDDVYQATKAALKAGAEGLIFSRKYSEMKLANLFAGGKAVKEILG